MAISPNLELRQSTSLVLTPQLQQAIKLLQLSSVELLAYVENELERNPLLERDGERDDDGVAESDIAGEANAQFIDELADDDLPGKPGDLQHTYLGLMQQNLAAMIPALGGDAAAVAELDTGNVFNGDSGAVYPQ